LFWGSDTSVDRSSPVLRSSSKTPKRTWPEGRVGIRIVHRNELRDSTNGTRDCRTHSGPALRGRQVDFFKKRVIARVAAPTYAIRNCRTKCIKLARRISLRINNFQPSLRFHRKVTAVPFTTCSPLAINRRTLGVFQQTILGSRHARGPHVQIDCHHR